MKKVILFIIIVNLSLCGEIIVKKDVNTVEKTVISIKKDFISGINYFIPEYIKISAEKSFISLNADYDTLNKNPATSLTVHLRFPAVSVKNVKLKKNYSVFSYKIRPYLRLKDSKIKALLSNSLTFKKRKLTLLAKYDIFTDGYYELLFQASFSLQHYISTLSINSDKDIFPNYSYTWGIYRPFFKFRKLFILGYEISGEKNSFPVIYSHKMFLSYREKIFNTKRFFFEIKPFMLFSKEYGFEPKIALDININYKF